MVNFDTHLQVSEETFFDMYEVQRKHNLNNDATERVEINVAPVQPDAPQHYFIQLGGALIEAGKGELFVTKVADFRRERDQLPSKVRSSNSF